MRSVTRALTLVALALAALAQPVPSAAAPASDVAVLNYALGLECLEAEFYSWAAYGVGLNDTMRGGGPESVGGVAAPLEVYAAVAKELADDEAAHVALLRETLGPAAAPCPAMDVGPAFAAAADAALAAIGNGTAPALDPPFSPYGDDVKFLHAALLLEDVGVMAYHGAIGNLTDPALATAARGIMAVEAYHAGVVRRSLADVPEALVEPYFVTVRDVTTGLAAAVEALLGAGVDLAIWDNLIPGALAYPASARQVENVLYLSRNATSGGFFPQGVAAERPCQLPAAMSYAQCGGDGAPELCCEAGGTCKYYNRYWSGCVPPAPANRTDVVPLYEQCGGKTHAGPTACEPGSACVVLNQYFSMCKPAEA